MRQPRAALMKCPPPSNHMRLPQPRPSHNEAQPTNVRAIRVETGQLRPVQHKCGVQFSLLFPDIVSAILSSGEKLTQVRIGRGMYRDRW
jgi:hypothetical protein